MSTEPQPTELKACPFCGNDKPTHIEITTAPGCWRVGCTRCGSYNNYSKGPERAVDQWNTRAADRELSDLRAKREDMRKQRDQAMWFAANVRAKAKTLVELEGDMLDETFGKQFSEAMEALAVAVTSYSVPVDVFAERDPVVIALSEIVRCGVRLPYGLLEQAKEALATIRAKSEREEPDEDESCKHKDHRAFGRRHRECTDCGHIWEDDQDDAKSEREGK